MKRQGRQTGLGDGLSRLMGNLDRKTGGGWRTARVSAAWEEIAGPTVNAHTAGVSLRGDELQVYVDSTTWATELSALSGLYLERFAEEVGQDLVKSIRFTVSRKVEQKRKLAAQEAERESFYAPEDVDPVPLTEQERAQVEFSASVIPNERVREAVVKATVANLELQKGRRRAKSPQKPRDGL